MTVRILDSPAAAGAAAAAVVRDCVQDKPDAVLGFATGSSPLPLYNALAESGEDFSGVRGFALDEYVGLPPGDPRSYATVINSEVVERLGLPQGTVRVPDAAAADLDAAAREYEQAIRDAGGVDLQILGIGHNGHVAFNEPGSALDSRTRVEELAERTRRANARFFDSPDEVPTRCLTQGLGTILDARHLLLIAHGADKAEIVARALQGPITPDCPASALQLHPRVTVVLDRAAAAKLTDTGTPA
ncbi:glucosamine-6-phosphate deaminase [Arthrobacter sp. zg-Y820]|uniref:glucosamine-6-phosphate deaminase n=1 Tax=unclassified Arthrobacter TaxID=235627 RepID=UPI001E4F7FC4|nr:MULTISPECIES: glucosamine-6-phosphate deaminase [unclassified Arthrobacter]MCC9195250.1 glucosamine-6-phosphate deaminase [Arthrobacter sp. zg-Y820]MDK1278109.1 glucosamine-6-phosphate deaminase [Arthrobacter sp. zg.Y820]WIB09999.1 glucosamine-6-phosphate deaminase [Arthrobacter sp. zg-Y820]